MGRRKGELTSAGIDRGWSHQVALPNSVTVARHREISAATEGLSLAPLPHWFCRNDEYWVVYCFAEAEHAERIAEMFGGELMTPETRPPWRAAPTIKRKKG